MESAKSYKFRSFIVGFFNPIIDLFQSLSREKYILLSFFIVPLAFLLNATVYHNSLGRFFLSSIDPEYFYLYNGILIGGGNLSVQLIAHPGIPLQYLIGLSSAIVGIFQPGGYIEGFIDDPEKYIHAANLFLNVLIALVLVICGIYTKRYSGSYFAGLLFQLSLFGSSALTGLSGRLIPESIMIIPMLLTGLMIIRSIYHDHSTTGYFNDIVLYGMIIGFGIACKLSFFPVILIPLVLLQVPARQKIRLLLYVVLFFAIFAYPVLFNFGNFWKWVSGIFIHSGKYGAGAGDFINLSSIPLNLKNLFNFDKAFFFVMLISLLLSLVFSFKIFKNETFTDRKIIRAILAVNLAIIFSITLTLKHYELYYFMPFYVFKYLLLLLSILLILQYQKISLSKRYKALTLILLSIPVVYMTYGQAMQVRSSIQVNSQRNEVLEKDYSTINSLVDKRNPLIMSCAYSGAPFIDYAHFNGFIMSYHLKFGFQKYLKEKFPLSYQYVTWSDQFYYWDDFVDFKDILDKTKSSFYIYTGKGKGDDLPLIEKRIWQVMDKNNVTEKTLYEDALTGERLVEIIKN
jgi:hypothetical protein